MPTASPSIPGPRWPFSPPTWTWSCATGRYGSATWSPTSWPTSSPLKRVPTGPRAGSARGCRFLRSGTPARSIPSRFRPMSSRPLTTTSCCRWPKKFARTVYTPGFGVRYQSPVGPIRVDVGINPAVFQSAGLRPGDVVLTLGAGDITTWAYALPDQLEALGAAAASGTSRRRPPRPCRTARAGCAARGAPPAGPRRSGPAAPAGRRGGSRSAARVSAPTG